MASHEVRKIEGHPGKPLAGNARADASLIDKRGGAATVVVNLGPDSLNVRLVTITSGALPNAAYTLGAPTAVAAGASHTITGLSRVDSDGRSRIRIEEA